MIDWLGYARVSTDDQAYAQALKHQVWRLQDFGCSKVFADVASRTKDDRAGLAQALSLIESGGVSKGLVIVRLDRITCSPGLFERISQALEKAKVSLKILDEAIDISSVEGEFTAGLQVMFAQREVRTIQLRSKRGHQHRRQQKRAGGHAPFGYQVVDGRYTFDHTPFLCLLTDAIADGGDFPGRSKAGIAADILELLFEQRSLHGTVRAIHAKYGIQKFKSPAKLKAEFHVFEGEDVSIKKGSSNRRGLFRWSADSLKVWLQNPVLRGHTAYNVMGKKEGKRFKLKPHEWEIACDTHPDKLLSEAQYRQIEQMILENRTDGGWSWKPRNNRTYPMSGLLYCSLCGDRLKVQSIKKHEVYYQCRAYGEGACSGRRMITGTAARNAAIARLTERAIQIAEMAEQPDDAAQDSPELHHLKQQLEGLVRLGFNPALEAAKQSLEAQIKSLEYLQRQKSQVDLELRELLVDRCSDPGYWLRLEPQEQRSLFRWLIDRVTVADGQVSEVKLKV